MCLHRRLLKTRSLFIRRISRNVQHSLAVDLQSDRAVESDGNAVTRLDLNDFLVVDVLSLEDRREDGECPDLAAAVEQEEGEETVLTQTVLLRRCDHAAAVIAAVH